MHLFHDTLSSGSTPSCSAMSFFSLWHFLTVLLCIHSSASSPSLIDSSNVPAVSSALIKRATPQSPNGYTPTFIDCPSDGPTVRSARGLSPNETSWLQMRRNNTVAPMRDLLNRLNITGFDVNSYITNNATSLPNVAIAVSGGGYRALLNGAGALSAFDNRTTNNTNPGQLGGLLQSATYLAGLSGGSWLVGSLYTNNFTSVQATLDTTPQYSGSLWQFENSIFEGPDTGGFQILDSVQYYTDIYNEVEAKGNAGFNTTITDYWGRALSFQLVNASDGGSSYTWSSVQNDPDFRSGNAPMPILVADGRDPNQLLVDGNATIFEFNPFEVGTHDPDIYAFVPTEYVGTNFTAGTVTDASRCVIGFDNVGFLMGTSSSLFNEFFLEINTTSSVPTVLLNALQSLIDSSTPGDRDISVWPNPFHGYQNSTNPYAMTDGLTLVDGGEDLENIPLDPLIQPDRAVDVIFAVDSSADTTTTWPNGTSLVATYQRSLNTSLANGTLFPSIPDQNTFVNLGLNAQPTFFGCNASNFSLSHGATVPPLIVYLPNAPYTYLSNFTTFTASYNLSARDSIVENGYSVVTVGNASHDAQWPTCVGCAILSRSLDRTGTTVPSVCNQCFEKYCWDGTTNSTTPATYEPKEITPLKNAAASLSLVSSVFFWSAAVVTSGWVLF